MAELTEAFSIVGKPLTKPDAFAKVSGQTKFADDLALPRMLYGRILRSPHPHARILHVDTARARALAGVHAVLVGEDLPVKFGILPVSQDEEALARERVRHVGDVVAAVVAETRFAAEEAAAAMEVDYEPLPAVVALREAVVSDAPLVHELARSLRSLRQCYAGTANRRLREALVREARDIVRRVCGFDVELP